MTANSIALFGARRPTLTHRAARTASSPRRATPGAAVTMAAGGHDRGAAKPAWRSSASLKDDTARPSAARGASSRQLRLRQQLVPCHAVVPRRVVLRRRHVVVVDDEGLGTGAEPGADGRGGGELVEQHVPGLAPRPRSGRRAASRTPCRGRPSPRRCARGCPRSTMTSRSRSVCRPTASARCSIGTNWWMPLTTRRPPTGQRDQQVDEPVRSRIEMQLGQAPPPGLDHCVAPGCVGEERRDGGGQRVGVLVRDEDPGPAEHLGHRTLVERHDGQRRRPWPRRRARRIPRARTSRPARLRWRRPTRPWRRSRGRRTGPRRPGRARPRSGAAR